MLSAHSNVVTFLWRTLYIQGVRRHGIATVIEIAILSGFFYSLLYSQEKVTPLSKESDEKDVRADLAAPFLVSHIVYSSQSHYNDKLMDAVAKEIFRLVKSEVKRLALEPLCLALSNTSESADIVLKVYAPVKFLANGLAYFELGYEDHNLAFDQAATFLHIIQQEHLKLQSEAFPNVKMNYNEHQGVMGLSDAEFFWGHFLTCLIIGTVESVISVILMTTVEYKGTTYAHGIDASLLTVSFIIFQIGLCLMIILLTWVFPKGGATWSLLTRRVLGKDSITILEIWGCMLLSDAVMAFLAWYLSKVLPWSTNNRQSPFFCLQPSYWNPEGSATTTGMKNIVQDPSRFEDLPPDTKAIITVESLTKVFGYKPALSSVDLKVYESRITVLLGHNGAGKTTLMSILTGMLAPTSGNATVCGFDVAIQRGQVRQRVSFCQQTDIFFDDMTCLENLLYFGSLKGARQTRLHESAVETMRVVGLEDKVNSMPNQLSGGMKRRLSIAMTLVSEPDLLILDEPTAGMDPETRRNVWDTLQKVAKQRTLLLSSHDMEEADAIADQIIVMSSGSVVCSGSTAFLKRACGVGYKLTFAKAPKAFDLASVMAIVNKSVPQAVVEDEKLEAVSVALCTMENTNFPGMFKALESSMATLGISGIGVTVASMKDVYLKINMDWAPGGKGRENPVEGTASSSNTSAAEDKPLASQTSEPEASESEAHVPSSSSVSSAKDIDAVSKPITKRRAMARSFAALFYKRLLSLVRSWDLYVIFFLVPLAMLALATWRSPRKSVLKSLKNEGNTHDVAIRLHSHFPDSTVVIGESPPTNVSKALRVLVESEGCSVRRTKDVAKELHKFLEEDFASYITTYPMAVAFNSNTIRMMPNPTSPMTLPITLNLVYTAWLRVLTAQPTAQMNLTITYLAAAEVSPTLVVMFTRLVSWWYWVVVAAFTYTLPFSVYASFPVDERLSGARDVQLMTGIWGTEFIFAHFVFDFINHAVYSAAWCAVHYGLSYYSMATARAITSALRAFFFFLRLSKFAQDLLLLVPQYTLLSLLVKIWNNEDKNLQCDLLKKEDIEVPKGVGPNCEAGLMEFSEDGVLFEFVILLVEGVATLAFMVFKTSGYLWPGGHHAGQEDAADEDIEEEKKKIEAARQKGDFTHHSLLVWSLHKRFGNLHAVRGVYMALRPSECFGLLGVNGAGKTTTFEMLAALISVSYGDASTAVAKLSENPRRWQSQISYCFQLGGLLDRLNAYEYLYLVGRLRGIPESELKPMVDSIVSVVDLAEHASKECGVYSGGNRRKLSIGAALLGLQPFVFLDEPYAGVDVVSRNKIFRAIAEIKKRSRTTFVLTSHNMDECEFSCDRLTIMVQGHMMCLGTLQHLREKFGKGYRLELLLKHTAAADAPKLNNAVQRLLPGIELKESHQNLLSYHLAVRVPWSEIFSKVVDLQKDFQLEHALVAENTLEDIFLNFAKAQEEQQQAAATAPAQPFAAPPHTR
ncbi:hypothetical protein HPB50_001293 [Hyalomma asiaticum]|uniref:Uncharacterized protein n=1 Tax=Hyalomma asiaticum TaxID=266040 RepID=A0ACB7RNS0_HYAAI|nr:hypothetical protein HPB50_001293 [Hyalomma asiaticum]